MPRELFRLLLAAKLPATLLRKEGCPWISDGDGLDDLSDSIVEASENEGEIGKAGEVGNRVGRFS